LTVQQLNLAHRQHLGVRARNVSREESLDSPAGPAVASSVLAARFVDSTSTPSGAAARAELQARVQQALELLEPIDREILALRHFEQLSNAEAAEVLGLKPRSASMRYYRALKRLRQVLDMLPGGLEGI
jgi:RNA polymerase sigma-70 factor (ECF subfamily)